MIVTCGVFMLGCMLDQRWIYGAVVSFCMRCSVERYVRKAVDTRSCVHVERCIAGFCVCTKCMSIFNHSLQLPFDDEHVPTLFRKIKCKLK